MHIYPLCWVYYFSRLQNIIAVKEMCIMSQKVRISYDPLWETMREKNVTTYKLIDKYNISKGTIDRLKHDRNVTIETLLSLCLILECDIGDVSKCIFYYEED